MIKDNRLFNAGVIVATCGLAAGFYLITGDLPKWWQWYLAGCGLVAGANLWFGWPVEDAPEGAPEKEAE